MAAAAEVFPSSLDLFSTSNNLISIAGSTYEKISTKTALSDNITALEFTVPPDKVYYTDLTETYFHIRCSYILTSGGAIGGEPAIGPVQYPVTSFFKSITMHINDQKISPNEDNMNYIHFLNVFMRPEAEKNTILSLGLYYEDSFDSLAAAEQSNPQATVNPNKGLHKRAQAFANSKSVDLYSKLYLPPHTTNRFFPTNLKFDYRFEFDKFNFFSMCNEDNPNYKLHIDLAELYVRRVKVSPGVQIAHMKTLQTKNMVFPTRYISTRTYNINHLSYQFKFDNVFLGSTMPVALFAGFVSGSAFHGNFKKNPFVFDTVKLQRFYVRLGNQKIPNIDYDMHIDENQSQMLLWTTYKALDYIGTGMGPSALVRKTYETGPFIFGFDLSRDGNPHAEYKNSTFEATSLGVEGVFRSSQREENLILIIWGVFQGYMELNSKGQVFASW